MSFEKAMAQLNKSVSRPSLFRVSIKPNEKNAFFSEAANDYIKFFCEMTAIPSFAHDTIPVNGHERVGVMREQPSAVVFEKPFTISVIERSDYVVHEQMRQWFNKTCPAFTNSGEVSQRMSYYDTFTCDISLTKLEYAYEVSDYKTVRKLIEKGIVTGGGYRKELKVRFINAYPTKIGAINLNSGAYDDMVKYSIDFNYESFIINDPYDLATDD